MTRRMAQGFLAVLVSAIVVGCSPATDRSKPISKEEMDKYNNKQAEAVDARTDLNPQQKEALKRFYGGGGPATSRGGPGSGPPGR